MDMVCLYHIEELYVQFSNRYDLNTIEKLIGLLQSDAFVIQDSN